MKAQIKFFGIVVKDMAKALAFYRHLGFDLPAEADDQPHVEATLPGGLKLVWDTVETIHSFDAGWKEPTGGHRVAFGFGLPTPADVDSMYKKLVSLGYEGHKEPWDAFWGMRYAMVLDPDGNSVDLHALLEQ